MPIVVVEFANELKNSLKWFITHTKNCVFSWVENELDETEMLKTTYV